MRIPDYSGRSAVNLMAELERRLTGNAPMPGLEPDLAALIPDAATYVLVLLDGLGSHQLDHPEAAPFREDHVGDIDAVFPPTTTVAMSTIATGLPPAQHGLLGYQQWLPEFDHVVNTIGWKALWGDDLGADPTDFLPAPNLWERLRAAGKEPITVQPGFEGTAMSAMLYRGCRYEAVNGGEEMARAAAELAAVPGRLIFVYLPPIDFAAHVYGQEADEYGAAVRVVADVWERIVMRIPEGAVVVGTADHGHADFPKDRQVKIAKSDHEGRIFYGDARVVLVKGEGASLAEKLPARWVPLEEMAQWWGPDPRHPRFAERAPDGALVADDGHMILHRFADDRLVGYHGGLTEEELTVPLLVASS